MLPLNKFKDNIHGDRHNGGKAVFLNQEGLVEKPRSCLAEWLFLSAQSPLRKFFEETSIFFYFPNLEFYGDNLSENGAVSFLCVDQNLVSNLHVFKASEAMGNLLAISQFFGLSDLHYENIKCGIDDKENFILAPIDIECLFQEIKLPFQTGLLQKENNDKIFGLKNLIDSNLVLPAQVVKSYLDTMDSLFIGRKQILKILNEVFGEKDISRILLRDTTNYRNWNHVFADSQYFCPEEISQLRSGDIPYFFRKLDSKKICYWSNGEINILFSSLDSFTTLSQVTLSELNTHWEKQVSFLKHGALQIADRLLQKSLSAQVKLSGIEIKKINNQLEIITSEWQVRCEL